MTKFDKEYLELCKKILTEGIEVENRTGINTIKVPSHTFKFDLSHEFPILQSKQTFIRQAITEMLWIWQMQSNDVRLLQQRDVHIWDEWMIDPDGIYRIYEPTTKKYEPKKKVPVVCNVITDENNRYGEYVNLLDNNGNILYAKSTIPGKNIKEAKYFGREYAYTIGTAYGYITKRYQHTQNLINTLKNNPNDRRLVKSLWQDEYIRTAVLPSCVWSTEWDVTNGKLNLLVHQRSCDVPLGLPFNVPQYATLLMMIAQVTNLEPGTIEYSIKDAHIYLNQIDGIKEQINRWNKYEKISKDSIENLELQKKYAEKFLSNNEKYELEEELKLELKMIELALSKDKPELLLNKEIDDFFKFDNSKDLKDIKLNNYKHLGKIKFPIAQ